MHICEMYIYRERDNLKLQGRIQDLKLGVAQLDLKKIETGGGGGLVILQKYIQNYHYL